ncbi:MerR family transcriptional regulator [Nocardia brasiliensis]|uniref:MerR family transcriptional regulator n=1 Tax=Nocardia brasiliensis TaxID=37326 RepID=UPI0024565A6A|nr:MerR family transcriptional regulator [Nocardia brasiliensis]
MTIDELAREAGTTVRSLRVYHERGVLPSPLMKGRTGFYGDDHLNRVRTIGRLLDRGIKLNGIRELLAAWDRGDDLSDILGVPDRDGSVEPIADHGSESDTPAESPVTTAETTVTAADLANHYRDVPNGFARVVTAGLYEPVDAVTYRVTEPHSLRIMQQFVAWGASSTQALEHLERIRSDCDRIARRLAEAFERTASQAFEQSSRTPEDRAELAHQATTAQVIAKQVTAELVGGFLASYLNPAKLPDELPGP